MKKFEALNLFWVVPESVTQNDMIDLLMAVKIKIVEGFDDVTPALALYRSYDG